MGLRIKQLSAAVANQIAAGEVIERPASVIKELLENAFDAKATEIKIELSYGGLNHIRVSDNGIGILASDLPLAVAAHATSKIENTEDLYQITSMGFRGEALASIASVSKLSICSKNDEDTHASLLEVQAGRQTISPMARNRGTSIDVFDLFYNLPVRKKFLKSERLEFLAVESVIKCFALSAPAIALELTHNGKHLLSLPAAVNERSQLKRIERLFGKAFRDSALYFEEQALDMQLRGWISSTSYQRSQNDRLWVYVNQRMVKDRLLQHAIRQSYETLLHPGRFPACLLYFALPAQEVDVNVHPAKHELRFHEARLVHDFFCKALTNALKPPVLQQESRPEPFVPSVSEEPQAHLTASYSLSDWFSLGGNYAIIRALDKDYLVNVNKLQEKILRQALQLEETWSARPLLVPVRYSFTPALCENIENKQELLEQLGIHIKAESGELRVSSIPAALPHLQLHEALTAIATIESSDKEAVINQLIRCHCLHASNLGAEEILSLLTYFHQHAAELCETKISRLFNDELCENLMHA